MSSELSTADVHSTCDSRQMCRAGLCGTALRSPPLNLMLVGTKQLQMFCKLTPLPRKAKGKLNLRLSGEVGCSHCNVKGSLGYSRVKPGLLQCKTGLCSLDPSQGKLLLMLGSRTAASGPRQGAHPLQPFNSIRHGAYHFSLKRKRKPERKSTVCSISTPVRCTLLLSRSFTPGSVYV